MPEETPDTRRFTLDQLRTAWAVDQFCIHEETIGSGRWTKTVRIVFQAPDDHQHYFLLLDYGLTEYQEQDPFERYTTGGDEEEIPVRCLRAVQKPVTEVRWVEAG